MFDEVIIRYKEMTLRRRLVLCFLLSLMPAIYIYLDQSSTIDEEYERAENAEKSTAAQLLKADNQLKNLQKTENDLEYTKDQLKKAESRLPDSVLMDEVLRTTGKLAKESSVKVQLFQPKAQIMKGDEYKYIEVPVKISVEAPEYSQICDWIDSVAGLKTKMYLKSWLMTRKRLIRTGPDVVSSSDASAVAILNPSMRAEHDGRQARQDLRLTLEGEFSLYKLASADEIERVAAAEGKSKPGAPAKPVDAQRLQGAPVPPPVALPGPKQSSATPSLDELSKIDEKGGAA